MATTEIDFTPNVATPQPNPGGQGEFAADWEHRFIAAEGGWGSGKTWIGARKLVTLHCHNSMDPKTGDATYVPSALLGPTYRNLYDIDIPMIEAACDDANLLYQVVTTKSAIVFPELGTKAKPSTIMFRSADKPELITGWEVGAFWGDEPTRWREDRVNPKRDPFVQILGRLRHTRARLLQGMFTYTNEGDATRVYEEFNAGKPDFALYRIGTQENPVMAEFYKAQLRILPEELIRQYLKGEAVSLRGRIIYGAYTESNNDKSINLVPGRPVCLFIDFNIRPGMHFGLGQYWPELDLFTVAKIIYQPDLDIRRGMPLVLAAIGRAGGLAHFGTLEVYGDATGRSRWVGTSESCYQIVRQCLDAEGVAYRVRVPDMNPSESDRVNAVNLALMDVEGRNHVKINPEECKRLIADFKKVRWDDRGREIDKRNTDLTHASDALGYWVHYLRPVRVKLKTTGGRFSVTV